MSPKIQETCQAILDSLRVPSFNISRPALQFGGLSNSSRNNWTLPPLQFPPIPSPAAQLVQLGCAFEESQEAANIFASRVKDLQSTYERHYEKLFRRLSKYSSNTELRNLAKHINRVLDARYSRNITSWQEAILQAASIRVQERLKQASSTDERPVFKPEWTPFLKKYFAQNAYPTHQDKVILATKTGMTVKQIYDWFQNHRTREKRKGIPLKRPDIEGSPEFSSEDSPTSRVTTPEDDDMPLPKKRRVATDEPLALSPVPSTSTQDFDFFCLPPDAVWPRSYSEKDMKAFWECPVEPNLGSFTWPRELQPDSRSRKRKALDSNIDEQIAESFASKLHFRSSLCKRTSLECPEETSDTFEPWSYHRLYPKRHPASVNYNQLTEPSKCAQPARPTELFPKYRRTLNSSPSSRRRASSSSSHSTCSISSSTSPPSSIASSPPSMIRCSSWSSLDTLFTPGSSPRRPLQSLGISGLKGFEVYAGPFVGLNMSISS
ncbi:homeodomain type 2 mating protein [Agaricus bisporus var. bisporus H97]|uniref:homeodomain type 2 mating protein n=1 Tax=Agaricus bisporus var. bisporus (strain H97 / ATCC MYA-4626 / FGSC 10389) TaxID=936046 RepID=UPI00029F7AE8|nr:homeodomain type 2 mating protein [Agaricus bisporus var. bisporus H97]EKV52007.1 homeodomain type 2 mating protein [Agaricus bisporus var. bisporus H97]